VALKAILDSLDEVPEAQHELYVERDGRFHLDVEGVVPQDRLREFRENNIKLMKEREELNAKLEKFKDIDPEKYQDAIKKLQELDDKKMLDEGKIEELLTMRTERLRTDYDNQIKAFQKKVTDLEASSKTLADELAKERIDGRLREAAGKVGIRSSALPDLINRGRQVWRLVEGNPVAMHGEQMIYGKDPSKPIAMDEWIGSLSDDAPHLFETSSGGGAQNQPGGGSRNGRIIPKGDPLLFGKNLEGIASGDVRVAQ
jgi:hypothetical protein